MASSLLMRPGRAKPDSVFLRQFPGKRRFEAVREDDWMAPVPNKDIAGFGHILRLDADVRVWSPAGHLMMAKKWPSRSYIRNFARILRNMFGQNVQLVDRLANNVSVALNNATPGGGQGLIPEILQETVFDNTQGNPDSAGAAFQIGNGVPNEDHTRNALVAPISAIINSRNNVRTSVQTTATTTLEITTGITNGQAVTVNVTEMGLFLYALAEALVAARTVVPFATLLAYDGFVAVPVATGGVIAPRYTMDFPV